MLLLFIIMLPIIDLKLFRLPLYGFNIFLGLAVSVIITYFITQKRKAVFADFIIIATCCFAFGFIGAKLLYILVSYPLSEIPDILIHFIIGKSSEITQSGFVFYGGLILGIPGYFIGCRIAKADYHDFLGTAAYTLPLVHAFGRIGCFCAGCCYGIRYESIFSVVYSHPLSSAPVGISLFPVQLVEALILFLISISILMLYKTGSYSAESGSKCMLLYIILYSPARFFIEFLRFDSERGKIFIFSTSQFISIILFITAVSLLIIKSIRLTKSKQ